MKPIMVIAGGALGALVAMAGCGGGGAGDSVPANGVAKVGDAVISVDEFNKRIEIFVRERQDGKPVPYEPPDYAGCVAVKERQNAAPEGEEGKSEEELRKECEQDYTQLRTDVMEFLLQEEWVRREAESEGVTVTAAAVKKAFERQRDDAFPSVKAYENYLRDSGRTDRDVRRRVEATLLQEKLTKKATAGKLKVTEAEIKNLYLGSKKQFTKPVSRDLRVVIAKTKAKGEEAKRELAAGESWGAVAKRFSIDKFGAANGAKLKGATKGSDAKIDAALERAKVGVVLGPMKTQFGWWVYMVEKVIPPGVAPLKEARPQILAALKKTKQEKALTEYAQGFRTEYRDQTVCAEDFEVASCKNGPAKNPTTPAPSMQQPQSQQDN